MIDVTTQSGFACQVDEEALDDMELLEELAELDKPVGVLHAPKALDRLIGKEQKAALYEHLRTASGRVKTSDVVTELFAIIKELNEGKK